MSNLAAGIPIGLAIGMGSGIATGIASGQSLARNEIAGRIRELAATHSITVRKPDGGYLSIDEFIELTTASGVRQVQGSKKTALWIAVLTGVLAVAGGALFLFLKLRS